MNNNTWNHLTVFFTRLFYGGSVRSAVAQTPQARNEPPWGSRYVQRRDTPDQIRGVDTTANPNVTHVLDSVD